MRSLRHLLALALLAGPTPALAQPLVFDSSSGDGVNSGVALVPVNGSPFVLDLWIDAGEALLGLTLSFQAEPGLSLVDFDPAPVGDPDAELLFSLVSGDGGTLSLSGGDGIMPLASPFHIGALEVAGFAPGSSLVLLRLPGIDFPAYLDTQLELVEVPTPQEIARVVPEPGVAALLLAGVTGLAATAVTRPRRARRGAGPG